MKPPANPITKTNGLTNKRNGNQQKDVNQKNTTDTPATNKRRKYQVAAKVDTGLRRKPTSKINNNNPEPQPSTSTSTAAAKPAAIVKQQRPVRQPVRKPSQVKAQPLSLDKGVVKFTAHPVAIAKKPTSKPRQTPNNRQSIARRPVPSSNSIKPKISVAAEPSTAKRQLVKPNTYNVKAKIDTGLKKKDKEKEDDVRPDQKVFFIQDLNNPTPSTSKGDTLNPLLQYYIFKSRGHEPPYCHSLDDLKQRAYDRDQEKKKAAWRRNSKTFGSRRKKPKTGDKKTSNDFETPTEPPLKKAKVESEKRLKDDIKKIILFSEKFEGLAATSSEDPTHKSNDEKLQDNVFMDETFEVEPSEDDEETRVIPTKDNKEEVPKNGLKTVSFKVPVNCDTKIHPVLPRTPLSNGFSTSKQRHLHCLGVDQSATIQTPKKSGQKLLFTPKKAQEKTPVATASNNLGKIQQPTENDLKELKESILNGGNILEAEKWLSDIGSSNPFTKKFSFWECKALVEEKKADYEAVMEVFEEAASKISEEENELLQDAVDVFKSRIPFSNKKNNKRSRVASVNGTPRVKKPELDPSNIFETNLIRFTLADNSSKIVQEIHKEEATPITAVFTPVRRSARLSRKSTGCDLHKNFSEEQMKDILLVPNTFLQ